MLRKTPRAQNRLIMSVNEFLIQTLATFCALKGARTMRQVNARRYTVYELFLICTPAVTRYLPGYPIAHMLSTAQFLNTSLFFLWE